MAKTRPALTVMLPALLLALLVVLAWLQYRWTGEISVAEQDRLEASLQSSVRRFSAELDDEAGLLFRAFRIEPTEELGPALRQRWEDYQDEARYPELIEAIYLYNFDGGELSKLEGGAGLESAEWPDGAEALRVELERRSGGLARGRRGGRPMPFPVLSGAPPALAIPVISARERRTRFAISGYIVLFLDPKTLRDALFPDLAARHFGEEYDVTVVDGNGRALFATGTASAPVRKPDAHGELLTLARYFGRPGQPPEMRDARRQLGGARWEIYVRHRSGSLETAVARARTRNLVVSFSVLGLLAASMVLLSASTRRATELNERKMEFVAGVSHELRTPVAVLRSAGQNLADGSVSEPEQVKRYGTLIETEGRRLNDLVEQVLELAGIQSNKLRYRREVLSVRAVVEAALEDCEALRAEEDVSIEQKLPEDDVEVEGDGDALRRALTNLLVNAIKHGGEGNAITVTVEARGDRIAIEVADRGPGIAEDDRAHLFEAFYRGRRALDRQIPGSGLGLSLVEHVAREHGGSIEVATTSSEGSTFTLWIPKPGNA